MEGTALAKKNAENTLSKYQVDAMIGLWAYNAPSVLGSQGR